MHTCISSHRLKKSRRSCPRQVNAGNKYTPSMHHPRRRNVTTLMVGLKKTVTCAKISPKNGEPQRYSWGMQKERKKERKNRHAPELSGKSNHRHSTGQDFPCLKPTVTAKYWLMSTILPSAMDNNAYSISMVGIKEFS